MPFVREQSGGTGDWKYYQTQSQTEVVSVDLTNKNVEVMARDLVTGYLALSRNYNNPTHSTAGFSTSSGQVNQTFEWSNSGFYFYGSGYIRNKYECFYRVF